MRIRILLLIAALLCIVGWGQFVFLPPISAPKVPLAASNNPASWLDAEIRILHGQADNLSPEVLKLSLTAYRNARERGMDDKQILTIVDYSKPSSERRLWVVDLKSNKVLFNTWVAHGKNSGESNSTSFSNQAKSKKSSLGVFMTKDTYSGHNGYSLRVQGLESGYNDHALNRDVVFHGADYVSADVAKTRGKLGRSWGCFAVGRTVIQPLINTIKEDTLVVAYYPDKNWLANSSYLHSEI